jgi:hypothetical protein
VVLGGIVLGLAGTFAVGFVVFALQAKLPYKKMLIVTGVMIGFVLVVMVGQTARTMQGTGWLPITPAPVDVPYWGGLWFGVFPTWETLGAQVVAFHENDLVLERLGSLGADVIAHAAERHGLTLRVGEAARQRVPVRRRGRRVPLRRARAAAGA